MLRRCMWPMHDDRNTTYLSVGLLHSGFLDTSVCSSDNFSIRWGGVSYSRSSARSVYAGLCYGNPLHFCTVVTYVLHTTYAIHAQYVPDFPHARTTTHPSHSRFAARLNGTGNPNPDFHFQVCRSARAFSAFLRSNRHPIISS